MKLFDMDYKVVYEVQHYNKRFEVSNPLAWELFSRFFEFQFEEAKRYTADYNRAHTADKYRLVKVSTLTLTSEEVIE